MKTSLAPFSIRTHLINININFLNTFRPHRPEEDGAAYLHGHHAAAGGRAGGGLQPPDHDQLHDEHVLPQPALCQSFQVAECGSVVIVGSVLGGGGIEVKNLMWKSIAHAGRTYKKGCINSWGSENLLGRSYPESLIYIMAHRNISCWQEKIGMILTQQLSMLLGESGRLFLFVWPVALQI